MAAPCVRMTRLRSYIECGTHAQSAGDVSLESRVELVKLKTAPVCFEHTKCPRLPILQLGAAIGHQQSRNVRMALQSAATAGLAHAETTA